MSNETPPFRDHPAVRAVIGFGRVPDAVDAAIERHRAAREELQRATGGVDAASNADGAAWADLLATRPGDVPGAVRLLRYVSGSPASEVVEDPQDLLRQLLAAVEAGETGSSAGEGAPGGAEPQAVVEPDPALAVVAEYRAAWDGLGEQIKTSWIGAAAEAADDAEAAAYARLRTVRPTTPAGFRALAETWAWRLAMTRNGAEADTVADNAADALIAGAGACVPAALAETAEKPVDWRAPPPGFMALPAIEPFGLALIPEGIAIELDRLRGIALAEFERQYAAGMTSEGEERLRRDLHLDTLSKAARGEGGFAVWPALGAEAAIVRDRQADPRLCILVSAWEAAERAGNAPGLSDEERAPLIDHASGLLRDLYAFPAHTMADICAKLPAFRDEAANTGDAPDAPDTEVTLEVCALRGIVADLERLVAARVIGAGTPEAMDAEQPVAPPRLDGDDPGAVALVSAIEAEWSIWAGLHGRERDEDGDRAFEASHARRDALLDAADVLPASSRAARHAKALARAWMDWVEDGRPNAPRGAYDFDGRLVFDIHASFMACERPAVSSDAETLVERILATWAALASAEDASDDAASEVLLEQRAALLREAERLPATRPHLVAKALAFAWIGHAHLWQVGQAREDYGIDGRLALDIEATARVPVAPGTGPNAEPEHELSALTVSQLARLYGALEPFEDLLGRAENVPCFWRGDGTERSPAGEIILQEADRLGQLVRAIADEMERRVPANGDERIDRLNVLVRRAAMLDGLNTDRALLTEALAACEA